MNSDNHLANTALHIKTPLRQDFELSQQLSGPEHTTNVFYKLENCQPTGSFKLRGIGNLIARKYEEGKAKQIVASSGGNAGAAAAYTANKLGIRAKVYVPETTGQIFIRKLKNYNAEVIVHGSVWDETDVEAREACSMIDNALYVPPFEHPLIWSGNSTIIDELQEQMGDTAPDCIIASVGGGGLILGVIEGCIRNKWIESGIKIIAVETEGADCFHQSVKQDKLVTLHSITSIAKSLGAKRCSQQLFEYYHQYKDSIVSLVLPDEESVKGTLSFLDGQGMLVEPSCGVSIAVALNMNKYFPEQFTNVVVVACGGTGLNLDGVNKLKNDFSL